MKRFANGTYNLREIDRRDDDGLTNSKASDESTSVNCAETATVAHEDSNTNNPNEAKLASSPNTTNSITDQESTVLVS